MRLICIENVILEKRKYTFDQLKSLCSLCHTGAFLDFCGQEEMFLFVKPQNHFVDLVLCFLYFFALNETNKNIVFIEFM